MPSDAVWFATTPVAEYLFLPSAGGLAAETWDGASWLRLAVPGQPATRSGLAALSYPDPAAADAMTPHAFFRTAAGGLAETYLAGSGWVTQPLPGQPAAAARSWRPPRPAATRRCSSPVPGDTWPSRLSRPVAG